MGTVISNLKARFGVDTSDFKKGLKDGEKAVDDFKGAAGNVLDEFASMFGVNMSGVNDAIGTANKSLNFLGQSFKAAAKGGDVLAISAKLLKVALISTGIGAIVVVLGSLVAYFTKSGEGADKFAKILTQVKSVVNNVIDRLAVFGKGLYEIMTGKFKSGWETMTQAFKGMGNEIKEDWKAAGALADAEDALEEREIALINSLEERKAKAAELRLMAKEEVEDQKKKLDLVKQAEALYNSVYADQISLEKERLRIMKEKLAIQATDPTDEQNRAIAEQEAKINGLLRERAEQLKGLNREKKTAAAAVAEELALEQAKANQVKISKADISSIKMPDFNIKDILAPLAEVQQTVKTISLDISTVFNDAFKDMAAGMGEFLGSLMIGDAGMKSFGERMGTAFADLAVTVGKLIISMAIAKGAIEKAIQIPGAWPVALAAGTALVALGTALRGSVKSAAGAGYASGSLSGSGSYSYDSRGAQSQEQKIHITGKLTAEGPDLVYVFNNENNRRRLVNGRG